MSTVQVMFDERVARLFDGGGGTIMKKMFVRRIPVTECIRFPGAIYAKIWVTRTFAIYAITKSKWPCSLAGSYLAASQRGVNVASRLDSARCFVLHYRAPKGQTGHTTPFGRFQ